MKTKQLIHILVLASILVVFLLSTNPNNISLLLILVPYVIIAIIVYKVVLLVLGLLRLTTNPAKNRLYATIVTVIITNLLLLKSIGQLNFQDGLISLSIILLSSLYISRFSFSR